MGRRFFAGTLVAASALACGSAEAVTCAELREAVRHAETRFAAVKGPNAEAKHPGAKNIFDARSVFAGGTECYVQDGATTSYSCTLAKNVDHEPNIAAFLAAVDAGEKCFLGSPVQRRGDPRRERANGASAYWELPNNLMLDFQVVLDRERRNRLTRRSVTLYKK